MSAFSRAPETVRWSVVVLAAYAAFVLVNATVWQTLGGWEEGRDYLRALARVGMLSLVIRGLLRRERWAWWVGVLLTGLWTVAGLGGYVFARSRGVGFGLSWPMAVPILVGGTLVLAALVLLLMPQTRAFVRSTSAPADQRTATAG